MKLTQLAAKPKLIKLSIDDEQVRERYGDALEFWIYDRQPMSQFVKLAQMKSDNFGEVVEVINSMILDEDGNTVIKDDLVLPTDIMTKVVGVIVETLGK
jgi:hypothetical protein